MQITNSNIGDFLFSNLGVKMILYGDINDIGGYVYNVDELSEIEKIYDELLEELELIGGNSVKYETYLMTNKIYSAYELYDEYDYQIIYYDNVDVRKQETDYEPLQLISRDIDNNRQYLTFFEKHSHYSPNNNNENDWRTIDNYQGYSYGAIPMLVGVNSSINSDMSLGYMAIQDGRTFLDEEIENGKRVCVINNDTYIIDREGIRLVEVGDIIPISVHVGDNIAVMDFEVIGINDAYLFSGLKVQSGVVYEQLGDIYMQSSAYINYIYIPNKCLEEIKDIFLDYCEKEDYKPIKGSFSDKIEFDGDEIFYSLYGGIRPLVIEIDSQEKLEDISNLLSVTASKLNNISDRPIDYTYFSNLDSFATVISNVNIGKTMFTYLSIIAILVCLLFFIGYVNNDINKRKKEIGISIALGMSKKEVMFQKLLEYLSIIIIPFILSTIIVFIVNSRYIEYINSSVLNIGLGSQVFDGYIETIDVSISIYVIVILIIMIFICLLLSCLVGYLKIKKLNIKDILLQGDDI